METIFTKIINGEIPCYKIAEDENNIAFLDIFPIQKGHTLCVPKNPTDKLFDLPEEDFLSLQKFSYKVAQALEKAIPCNRIGQMVLGLEVPHAHIHLIPMHTEQDVSFANPKLSFSKEEFEGIVSEIQKFL